MAKKGGSWFHKNKKLQKKVEKGERPSHVKLREVIKREENVAPEGFETGDSLVLYDIENGCITKENARFLGWQIKYFMERHGYDPRKVRIHAIAGMRRLLPKDLVPLLKEGKIRFRYALSRKKGTADKNLKKLLRTTRADDAKAGKKPGTIVMMSSDKGYGEELALAKRDGYNVITVYDPKLLDPTKSDYLRSATSICPHDDFLSL